MVQENGLNLSEAAGIFRGFDALPDQPTTSGVGSASKEVSMTVRIWGLSKKDAHYRPAPEPDVRCARCKYMFPPLALGGCRLVRGPIRGSATCDKFTARRAIGG